MPITVELLDQSGQPVVNGFVQFHLGGDAIGLLYATSATTDSRGLASVNYVGPHFATSSGTKEDIVTVETSLGMGPSVSIIIPESQTRFENVTPNFTVEGPNQVRTIEARLFNTWGELVIGLGPVTFWLVDGFISDDVGALTTTPPSEPSNLVSVTTDGDGWARVTYTGPAEPPGVERRVKISIHYGDSTFTVTDELFITVLAEWDAS